MFSFVGFPRGLDLGQVPSFPSLGLNFLSCKTGVRVLCVSRIVLHIHGSVGNKMGHIPASTHPQLSSLWLSAMLSPLLPLLHFFLPKLSWQINIAWTMVSIFIRDCRQTKKYSNNFGLWKMKACIKPWCLSHLLDCGGGGERATTGYAQFLDLCPGIIHGSTRGPYVIPGNKLGWATFRTSSIPTLLSLQPDS